MSGKTTKPGWKIPVAEDGSIAYCVRYPDTADYSKPLVRWEGSQRVVYHWEEPDWSFVATIKIHHCDRDGTSPTFWFENVVTHAEYPMRLSEFMRVIQTSEFFNGETRGRWGVSKMGANFSLIKVGDK